MIQLTDIHMKYRLGTNTVEALKGVSLNISQGTFVAIVGPSGSGKSTLLHLIGGLATPSSGVIKIGNVAIESLSDAKQAQYRNQQIGFIFQNFHLQKHLTAIENVALPLKIRGVKVQERYEKSFALLCDMGLKNRLEHLPAELSGGEQQRVAIARALIGEPLMLLGDEPTGNLDSNTGQEIMDILQFWRNKYGFTLIIVTHDEKLACLAKRTIFLKDGKIVDDIEENNASK